jgi:hypothetical protein
VLGVTRYWGFWALRLVHKCLLKCAHGVKHVCHATRARRITARPRVSVLLLGVPWACSSFTAGMVMQVGSTAFITVLDASMAPPSCARAAGVY